MAAYGDYATTCPLAFTQATLHKSYPGSTEAPFTILSEWGPTASGISGFNVSGISLDLMQVEDFGKDQVRPACPPASVADFEG